MNRIVVQETGDRHALPWFVIVSLFLRDARVPSVRRAVKKDSACLFDMPLEQQGFPLEDIVAPGPRR